jgi:hypothetical protein
MKANMTQTLLPGYTGDGPQRKTSGAERRIRSMVGPTVRARPGAQAYKSYSGMVECPLGVYRPIKEATPVANPARRLTKPA